MTSFPKPIVLICHGLDSLAGSTAPNRGLVTRLSDIAFVRTVCPETELGLASGASLRLVLKPRAKNPRLVHVDTGDDLTDAMKRIGKGFADSLGEADGIVLEQGSTTCALNDAAVFRPDAAEPFAVRPGFFADLVLQKHARIPASDDAALRDTNACHHFLTRVYTMARLRGVRVRGTAEALAQFHSDHELLIQTYGPKAKKKLDQLAVARNGRTLGRAIQKYADELGGLLKAPASPERGLDALYRAAEELAPRLTLAQRFYFFSLAERFAAGSISLGEVLPPVCDWIGLFADEYLRRQVFFRPYPRRLLDPLGLGEVFRRGQAA